MIEKILNELKRLGWIISGDMPHLLISGKEYRYVFRGDIVNHDTKINGEWVTNDVVSVKDFLDKLKGESL